MNIQTFPHLPVTRTTRSFMSVWLPSIVAIVASGACLFTASWWLSTTPGGGATLGIVVGISSVVSLVSNTLAAGAVDRGNRRRIVLVLSGSLILAVICLGALLRLELTTVVAIVAVAVCYCWISTSETIFLGVSETTAADLSPTDWPGRRTALLTQVHSQFDRIIAPVFAGALIGAGHVAAVPVIAVILLVVVAGGVVAVRRNYDAVTAQQQQIASRSTSVETGGLRRLFHDARAAVSIVRRSADLSYMVGFGILGNLAVFPFYTILPAYLLEFGGTPNEAAVWFGYAAAAYGIGMLVGSSALLFLPARDEDKRGIGAASLSLAAICAVIAAATFAASPVVIVVALGVVGALFSVLTAVGGAVWLRETPADVRARVFSLRRLTVYSSIPLGSLVIGVGGATFGFGQFARWIEIFVLIALGVIWALRTRSIRLRRASQDS